MTANWDGLLRGNVNYFYVLIEMNRIRSGKRPTNIRSFNSFITGPFLMDQYRAIGQHLRNPLNPPQLQMIQLKGRYGFGKEGFEDPAAKRPQGSMQRLQQSGEQQSLRTRARKFGGAYLCLEWLGSEYRADGELPKLTPEGFEH